MISCHVPSRHSTSRFLTFHESNHSKIVCSTSSLENTTSTRSRRLLLLSSVSFAVTLSSSSSSTSSSTTPSNGAAVLTEFSEIPGSGGVKALNLRLGFGSTPVDGDQVTIHYYGRLAAKQGWRFDSTYDHKDSTGEPIPFTFILGSGKVISGIESTVRTMRVGGIRRVIIPPSQGYQNTTQEPLPQFHLISLTGKGCSLQSSIQRVLRMDKVRH